LDLHIGLICLQLFDLVIDLIQTSLGFLKPFVGILSSNTGFNVNSFSIRFSQSSLQCLDSWDEALSSCLESWDISLIDSINAGLECLLLGGVL